MNFHSLFNIFLGNGQKVSETDLDTKCCVCVRQCGSVYGFVIEFFHLYFFSFILMLAQLYRHRSLLLLNELAQPQIQTNSITNEGQY